MTKKATSILMFFFLLICYTIIFFVQSNIDAQDNYVIVIFF